MKPSGPDEIKLPIDFSGRYKTIQDMYLTPTKILKHLPILGDSL